MRAKLRKKEKKLLRQNQMPIVNIITFSDVQVPKQIQNYLSSQQTKLIKKQKQKTKICNFDKKNMAL